MNTQPEALRRLNEVNGELADKLIAKSDRVIELEILNKELLEALTMLLSYTKACEGLLNCKPAGQIEIAEAAIAKATN